MMFYILILAVVAMALFILNVYQFLTQRAALRIADILYIMSRNVREKAAEVRRDRKDVEIVEAHLFDISTSARSLLRALGRRESTLGPDPSVDLIPGGSRPSADSLLRLADNILYGVIRMQNGNRSRTEPWNVSTKKHLDWTRKPPARSFPPWAAVANTKPTARQPSSSQMPDHLHFNKKGN